MWSSDGEQEELWLQDAGLSPLVTGEEEDVDNAVLLSTLTKTQAAAVQRRIDSYTCSLRKRNKTPARHVRDVFASPIAQVTAHLDYGSTNTLRGRSHRTRFSIPNYGFPLYFYVSVLEMYAKNTVLFCII